MQAVLCCVAGALSVRLVGAPGRRLRSRWGQGIAFWATSVAICSATEAASAAAGAAVAAAAAIIWKSSRMASSTPGAATRLGTRDKCILLKVAATCLATVAIHAIDVGYLPAVHHKTTSGRLSLMDLGMFMFAAYHGCKAAQAQARADLAERAREGDLAGSPLPPPQPPARRSLPRKAVLHVAAYFALGLARTLVTTALRYPVDEAEYGRGWNAFFTLGCCEAAMRLAVSLRLSDAAMLTLAAGGMAANSLLLRREDALRLRAAAGMAGATKANGIISESLPALPAMEFDLYAIGPQSTLLGFLPLCLLTLLLTKHVLPLKGARKARLYAGLIPTVILFYNAYSGARVLHSRYCCPGSVLATLLVFLCTDAVLSLAGALPANKFYRLVSGKCTSVFLAANLLTGLYNIISWSLPGGIPAGWKLGYEALYYGALTGFVCWEPGYSASSKRSSSGSEPEPESEAKGKT